MKQLIILVTLFFSYQTIYSQDKKEILAEKTCECLKTKNFEHKNKEEIQMELGLCMLTEAKKLKIEIDLKDNSSIEKLGEEVGLKMAVICPESFVKYLSQEAKDGSSLMDDYKENKKINGIITKFTKDDLAYLFVKTAEGREVKLILLEYFINAENLIEQPKELVNKKVSIEYKEVEYYLPRIGEFVKMKEIKSLTFD